VIILEDCLNSVVPENKNGCDRTNAIIAGFVYAVTFIVYALTVQRGPSFWDCGEMLASSSILGIPHPPGTPLFIIIGRIFSMLPFVDDISYRINYISVISSAFTAMFSYLLAVRLIRYFVDHKSDAISRLICYVGGVAGAFFAAFGRTNWGNSVEAEVYGMALAMMVAIVWLTVRFYEQRGTASASKAMFLAMYIALLGVGIHMTVFLVVPTCAIFFILNRDAERRHYLVFYSYLILELLLIVLFADGRGGKPAFYFVSGLLSIIVFVLLYKRINWGMLIAVGSASAIMLGFDDYQWITPAAALFFIALGLMARKMNWTIEWKAGLALVLIGFLGISVHFFIPIRSAQNPRIDENKPSRNWETFISFLDRKQYGQISMVERMFKRRAEWSHQFGRHAHMGYWSFFEEQYSKGHWSFIFPFFALGLLGCYVAIKKRLEMGLPFLALLLVCSVGLILYMNFADGTKYGQYSTDAYLEVRDRDYFFTPAFVFFGIAMGLGVAGLMQIVKERVERYNADWVRPAVYVSGLLVFLPAVTLAHNYHVTDRSKNQIAWHYARNILDTCEQDAILFTSGDNDTFPLWALQEAYGYRQDVRIVNLSLLNTDWYVEQMKRTFNVPMSLTTEQILWEEYGRNEDGVPLLRPKEMFNDRPRRRRAYLQSAPFENRMVRVQDMIVDDIVIENNWRYPIYFSAMPYAESPLRLREKATTVGQLFRLDRDPPNQRLFDTDKTFDLYMNKYRYDGFANSDVYRDENATGVFIGVGINGIRLFEDLRQIGDTTRAVQAMEKLLAVYPEYWQAYAFYAEFLSQTKDSGQLIPLYERLHDTLTSFLGTNPDNLFYMQDLGMAKFELGRLKTDPTLQEEGLRMIWNAFNLNANNSYAFRKLASVLTQMGRYQELTSAAKQFANYKMNLEDPYVQRLLGIEPGTVPNLGGEY
jgi:tetratricopeptide (TPR) repeat protein